MGMRNLISCTPSDFTTIPLGNVNFVFVLFSQLKLTLSVTLQLALHPVVVPDSSTIAFDSILTSRSFPGDLHAPLIL